MEAANTALEKRNQKLQDKFQDLKKKLELIEKHSASIITVNAEKESSTKIFLKTLEKVNLGHYKLLKSITNKRCSKDNCSDMEDNGTLKALGFDTKLCT